MNKYIILFLIQSTNTLQYGISRRNLIASSIASSSMLSEEDTANNNQKSIEADVDYLTIRLYGPITTESCYETTKALFELDMRAKHKQVMYPNLKPHISLHIQSTGGELMPTFYVCDTIRNLDTPVYTFVDGYAASAATLITVSGKKRFMTKHSSILIHQLKGETSGKFNEMRDEMINMNFFMQNVKDIYLEKGKFTDEQLQNLLDTDMWLDAKTCMKYGLIDHII